MAEFPQGFNRLPQIALWALVRLCTRSPDGTATAKDASVLAQLNLPDRADVALILGNTWNPLATWNAHWTFQSTALKEEFDESLQATVHHQRIAMGIALVAVLRVS